VSATAKKMTALRIAPDELEEIDRRARAHRMTRTEYMVRAALEDLPATKTVVQRLEALEHRLERLEGQAAETP
jgi:uncharacterized protein (DUF1778 family)